MRARIDSLMFDDNSVSLTVDNLKCHCDDEDGPEIKIVSGAYKIGKVADTCEDAFFITERGFGVADGVSGWNDYGFSSSEFSE